MIVAGNIDIDKYLTERLNGKTTGEYATLLSAVEQGRFTEERHFSLDLLDGSGRKTVRPVFEVIYFFGRGRWIKPWAEVRYYPCAGFNEKDPADCQRLDGTAAEDGLFDLLGMLIPPAGRIMVEYGFDDMSHGSTAWALRRGMPPSMTPLGQLLWKKGFRAFKDWYFPEGGREGEMKLQAEKPFNKEQEKEMMARVRKRVAEYERREA